MSRSLPTLTCGLLLLAMLPAASFAQSEMTIVWTGFPGQIETTIMADTLADGTQAHDVYVLQKGKIYLQLEDIIVNDGFTLRGEEFDPDNPADVPAIIQALPGPDGLPRFNPNWMANFWMMSPDATLRLENLVFTGAFADESIHLAGIVVNFGPGQTVEMENCVVTDYQVLALAAFFNNTSYFVNNTVFKANSSGPGLIFYMGAVGGGGSWMGTYDKLYITNSSIANYFGNPVLIYEQVNEGLIDHVTFANILLSPINHRGGNNMEIKNSLYYNTGFWGFSHDAISEFINGYRPAGVMDINFQSPDPDGEYNSLARNIIYHHNAWARDDQVLSYWQDTSVLSCAGDDITACSPAPTDWYPVEEVNVWVADSTLSLMALDPTIQEYDNVETLPTLQLAPEYLAAMIGRTNDYRDELAFNTPPYDGHWWNYEHDGCAACVEWPMHEDLRYTLYSPAATASETGGPVGDPRWVPINNVSVEGEDLPEAFTLDQNYPNPFNPSTEIAFTLAEPAAVKLVIYNVLGQEVKSLVDGRLASGSHSYSWNGKDNSGVSAPSGVYLYSLTAGNRSVSRKMALVK